MNDKGEIPAGGKVVGRADWAERAVLGRRLPELPREVGHSQHLFGQFSNNAFPRNNFRR